MSVWNSSHPTLEAITYTSTWTSMVTTFDSTCHSFIQNEQVPGFFLSVPPTERFTLNDSPTAVFYSLESVFIHPTTDYCMLFGCVPCSKNELWFSFTNESKPLITVYTNKSLLSTVYEKFVQNLHKTHGVGLAKADNLRKPEMKIRKIKIVILSFKIVIWVLHDGLDLVGKCKIQGVNFKWNAEKIHFV